MRKYYGSKVTGKDRDSRRISGCSRDAACQRSFGFKHTSCHMLRVMGWPQ